jgi:hypothetical protein
MQVSDAILQDLFTYCQVKALDDKLNPTLETEWKAITRAYSERFHVPLPQVRQMDPESVISEVLEAQYEEIDVFEKIEHILEEIYRIDDPNYDKQQKIDMDAFIKVVEKREKKRLEAVKRKESRQKESLRGAQPPMRSGGSVDFSKLKNEG